MPLVLKVNLLPIWPEQPCIEPADDEAADARLSFSYRSRGIFEFIVGFVRIENNDDGVHMFFILILSATIVSH